MTDTYTLDELDAMRRRIEASLESIAAGRGYWNAPIGSQETLRLLATARAGLADTARLDDMDARGVQTLNLNKSGQRQWWTVEDGWHGDTIGEGADLRAALDNARTIGSGRQTSDGETK